MRESEVQVRAVSVVVPHLTVTSVLLSASDYCKALLFSSTGLFYPLADSVDARHNEGSSSDYYLYDFLSAPKNNPVQSGSKKKYSKIYDAQIIAEEKKKTSKNKEMEMKGGKAKEILKI